MNREAIVKLKLELKKAKDLINYCRHRDPNSARDYELLQRLIGIFDNIDGMVPHQYRRKPTKKPVRLWSRPEIFCTMVIPTRDRVALLDECVRSIYEKAVNKSSIETIVICDTDDTVSIDKAKELQQVFRGFPLILKVRERSDMLLRDYQNWGASMARGRLIWGFNDDAQIVTNEWDRILFEFYDEEIDTLLDRIAYIHVADGCFNDRNNTCCFPIFPKETVDAMGGTNIAEFPAWGSDHALWEIWNKIMEPRIFYCHNVQVKHVNTSKPDGTRDLTGQHVHKISQYSMGDANLCQQYVDKINNKMIESMYA